MENKKCTISFEANIDTADTDISVINEMLAPLIEKQLLIKVVSAPTITDENGMDITTAVPSMTNTLWG